MARREHTGTEASTSDRSERVETTLIVMTRSIRTDSQCKTRIEINRMKKY